MRTGGQLVHLDVTLGAFGIAEVRLLSRRRAEGGANARTCDGGVPVDVNAKLLRVAGVRISHQCSAENEGVRTGDLGAHKNVTLKVLGIAEFRSRHLVESREEARKSEQAVQKN